MADQDDNPVYTALIEVKPEDLKLGTWATRAGLARNVFNDIRKHGNPKRETLQKLLDAIGASVVQFEAAIAPVATEVVAAPGAADTRRPFNHQGLPALPLLGTAAGGSFDDIDEEVETVELRLFEVLDYLVRPQSLASDPKAYALTILGDSMAPRFEPGERIAVTPREPISIGDDVVVQLRGREGDDERIKLVLVKRLVRRTPAYIELRQFNPDRVFRVDARRVAHMHKVRRPLD